MHLKNEKIKPNKSVKSVGTVAFPQVTSSLDWCPPHGLFLSLPCRVRANLSWATGALREGSRGWGAEDQPRGWVSSHREGGWAGEVRDWRLLWSRSTRGAGNRVRLWQGPSPPTIARPPSWSWGRLEGSGEGRTDGRGVWLLSLLIKQGALIHPSQMQFKA